VRAAKEHIAAGDIYQVVLSQRFEAEVAADPFTVYRALRHVNPSPYMFFIRIGGVSVVGSSPEMLVRVEGSRVETHPIAGTRPRGRTDDEDMRLAEELKRNEKERAEHVMLVDLGRNDVGRVCAYGSVRVPQFMGLEKFSHVMHLTSIVEGKLADDRDRLDALVSCFPAGTVSGAPKVRAMATTAPAAAAMPQAVVQARAGPTQTVQAGPMAQALPTRLTAQRVAQAERMVQAARAWVPNPRWAPAAPMQTARIPRAVAPAAPMLQVLMGRELASAWVPARPMRTTVLRPSKCRIEMCEWTKSSSRRLWAVCCRWSLG